MTNNDDDFFINLANMNSDKKHAGEYAIKIMKEAEEKSVGARKTKFGKKEKINNVKFKAMICVVAIVSSIVSSLITYDFTKLNISSNNVVIPITTELKNKIDNAIDQYCMDMNEGGKDEIVYLSGYNPNDKKPYTVINEMRMSSIIEDIARSYANEIDCEIQIRCLVKAMEEVIGNSYDEDSLRKAFDMLNNAIKANDELKQLLPPNVLEYLMHGFDGYLQLLGYESMADYRSNERSKIKERAATIEAGFEYYFTTDKSDNRGRK